jgi:phosphoenolpyruvate synthase/pyruvate phosphate dikinase
MTEKLYNIVRKHNGGVTIFQRNLKHKDAVTQIKHWKRMARNSGGRVFFDMVEVPYEMTPEGIERARIAKELRQMEERIERRIADCIAASHPLDESGWCEECMVFPHGALNVERNQLLTNAVAA